MSSNARYEYPKFQAESKKECRKIYVLLFDYRLGDMLSDDLALKIRELNSANTILISAYELEEDYLVTNLKHKNCIVVDIIQKVVGLTLLMGGIEQFV